MTTRPITEGLGARAHGFEGLTEAEAWIERRVGYLITHECYTAPAARARATGELADLAAHEGARQVWEPRIFGRRLPLAVERLLPEIQRDRHIETRSERTVVAFPWDSRTYIALRGDDGWRRFTFIGHRICFIATWSGQSSHRKLEVTW